MVEQNQFITGKLNSDLNPSLQDVKDIEFLLNGDFTSYANDGYDFFIQNVASNELCWNLAKEILGVIKLDYNQFAIFSEDEIGLFDADNCTYVSQIIDSCLNFGKVSGVYKYTPHGRTLYFIDTNNPLRHYNIDKEYPHKSLTKCASCKQVYSNRLDCEQLLVWKNIDYPTLTIKKGAGNLPSGKYQIGIAFNDKNLRLTDYFIYPNIITISPYEKTSINLEFGCFSSSLKQYEIVLIAHRSDRGTVAQRIGYFETENTSLAINQLDSADYTPIDTKILLGTKSYYQGFNFIDYNSSTTDGQLVLAGLTERKPLNYWHQAFNIKSKWQEIIVPAKDAYKYPSHMRDEVYMFEIAWLFKDGQISPTTHIPNTVALNPAWDVYVTNNDTWATCDNVKRKYWDIYNTASVIDSGIYQSLSIADCDYKLGNSGTFGYWESQLKYPDHINFNTPNGDYRCTGLRGFKFPDNKTSTHHRLVGNKEYVIVLTPQFSNIEKPKDCDGNYVKDIVGYIIYVSDRTNHKSVLHKGMISNMFQEKLVDCSNSYYNNYPFNDLNKDVFLSKTKVLSDHRTSFTPVDTYSKDKFTYISPDVDYLKNTSGEELYLYSEENGTLEGSYNATNEFPQIKALANSFYTTLSAITGVAYTLQTVGNFNVFGIGSSGGAGTSSLPLLMESGYNLLHSALPYREYGTNYYSHADYNTNNFTNITQGNIRRQITYSNYLTSSKQIMDGDKINNYEREQGLYIKLNSSITDPFKKEYSRIRTKDAGCQNFKGNYVYNPAKGTSEVPSVSSYYAGFKVYQPTQYGSLNHAISISKYFTQDISNFNETPIIFSGDIYITKHKKLRKFPFFKSIPPSGYNDSGFLLEDQFNVWKPRFWMNYVNENIYVKTLESLPLIGFLFDLFGIDIDQASYNLEYGNIFPATNCGDAIDCTYPTKSDEGNGSSFAIGRGRLFENDGNIYTHVVGLQEYWCESEFVSDFRQYNEIKESNLNVDETELIKYNRIINPEVNIYDLQYLWNGIQSPVLPVLPKISCCCEIKTDQTRVIFSQNNNIESNGDKWLSFLPNNYHQFVGGEGIFTAIHRINEGNMLFAFENAIYVTQSDTGLITNQGTVYLGEGSIFKRRMKRLSDDETGFSGSIDQHSFINTRYGVYWIDKLRKRFFHYDGQLNDITDNIRAWANQFLSNTRNTIIGVFDNYTENLYFTSIEQGNEWTISYKPKAKTWVSYHSFVPQTYLQASNNFLSITGNSFSNGLKINNGGIWKHNKQYSYQNYYGTQYSFDIGYVLNNKFKQVNLQSIQLYADFIKEYGYGKKEFTKLFFDKFVAFTNKTSTGLRVLTDNKIEQNKEPKFTQLNDGFYRINNLKNYADGQPLIEKTAIGYNLLNSNTFNSGNIVGFATHIHLINEKDLKVLLKLNLEIEQENVK